MRGPDVIAKLSSDAESETEAGGGCEGQEMCVMGLDCGDGSWICEEKVAQYFCSGVVGAGPDAVLKGASGTTSAAIFSVCGGGGDRVGVGDIFQRVCDRGSFSRPARTALRESAVRSAPASAWQVISSIEIGTWPGSFHQTQGCGGFIVTCHLNV